MKKGTKKIVSGIISIQISTNLTQAVNFLLKWFIMFFTFYGLCVIIIHGFQPISYKKGEKFESGICRQ